MSTSESIRLGPPPAAAQKEAPVPEAASLEARIRRPLVTRREAVLAGIGTVFGVAVTLLARGCNASDDDEFSRDVLALDSRLLGIERDLNAEVMANGRLMLTRRGKLALLDQWETELGRMQQVHAGAFRRAPILQERLDRLLGAVRESRRIVQARP